MKRKYFAAAMLLVATSSCGLAYQLAQAAERDIQMARASQDSQLQSLDARLGEKVMEFLELNELLAQQLENARQLREREKAEVLLTGAAVETLPQPLPEPQPDPQVEPQAEAPEPEVIRVRSGPPWWTRYQASMVVSSAGVRSAVVNGRYVRRGDSLGRGVVVRDIRPGQVSLSRGGQVAVLKVKDGR